MSTYIQAAGGLVMQRGNILFIKKNGKWDLPKGRLKKNAKKKITAVREINEETGLNKKDLKIIKPLIPTYFYNNSTSKYKIKETHWFFIEYTGDLNIKFKPQLSEGITECKWIKVKNLKKTLRNAKAAIPYLVDFIQKDPIYKEYI